MVRTRTVDTTRDESSGGFTEKARAFVRYTPDGSGLPDDQWERRHRNILVSLALHVPFLVALGLWHGTDTLVTGATIPVVPLWLVASMGGLTVGLLALASVPRLGRRWKTASASLGLMVTSTMLVRFSGGFIEAHFHFFIVMAIIAVYEDWMPFGLGLGYVAVGHVVFAMADPSNVFNHGPALSNPWAWSGIHAVGILMLTAALMTNWISIEKSREESAARLAAVTEANDERAAVERLNDHLEAKADDFSETMDRAADGELVVRVDAQSESHAMSKIGHSVNRMIGQFESAMEEIQTFASSVSDATDGTTASVGRAKQASVSVNASMEDIAENASGQRELLAETATEMSTLSATVEEVAASAQEVASTSDQTASLAESGEDTALEARERMGDVEDAVEETVENIRALDAQMSDIDDIVEMITDIAEQTNLLALNANIEAARAGHHGDGFAVVADEVKTLAEETQDAATEIADLIHETQAKTETTVAEVRVAADDIDAGVEAVGEVADVLSEVSANTEDTNEGVQEISQVTDEQAATTEETVSMVEPVMEISEETASEAVDVVEMTDEQARTMGDVAAETRTLAREAERLQELLQQFTVGTDRERQSDRAGAQTRAVLNDGGHR